MVASKIYFFCSYSPLLINKKFLFTRSGLYGVDFHKVAQDKLATIFLDELWYNDVGKLIFFSIFEKLGNRRVFYCQK